MLNYGKITYIDKLEAFIFMTNKTHRKIAREMAVIGIYQYLLVHNTYDDIVGFLKEDKTLYENPESLTFSEWLVQKTLEHEKSYVQLLSNYLKKDWTFDRLSVMERAILLIATCELLESELPKTIVINEAVVLAKRFCDDDSYKFINGILSRII